MNNLGKVVVFTTHIQEKTPGRFQIPKKVCKELEHENAERLSFIMEDRSGNWIRYDRRSTSGREMLVDKNTFREGQKVRIIACDPEITEIVLMDE